MITVKKFSGGGTSDYTVEMILSAIKEKSYQCFVDRDTTMPLLAMEDAIIATLMLMLAPKNRISIRTSYNLGGMTFSACDLEEEIKKYVPEFSCSYVPDFRQIIADSWPDSVEDTIAKKDWGWQVGIEFNQLVKKLIMQKK